MTMLLSVVVPTYNECENIARLIMQVMHELVSIEGRYEILVVDDTSCDGTVAAVRQCAQQWPAVRLLQREGVRDLSAALALGFDASAGEYVVAMDADLQHDPAILLRMLEAAQQADLVIATRYAAGGETDGWEGWRRFLSLVATRITQVVLPVSASDPLSGYFLLRRQVWQQLRPRLQLSGFKLLLEILVLSPGLRCAETGYRFTARQQGDSKFGWAAAWLFLVALWRLRGCR